MTRPSFALPCVELNLVLLAMRVQLFLAFLLFCLPNVQVEQAEQGLIRRTSSAKKTPSSTAADMPPAVAFQAASGSVRQGESQDALEARRQGGWPHLRLVAREHIPAEEAILALPPHCVVPAYALRAAAERWEGHPGGGEGQEGKGGGKRGQDDVSLPAWPQHEPLPYADAPDDVVLTAWLLRERAKGRGSPWQPLLDLLPARSPIPLFWTQQQLQELELRNAMLKVRAHQGHTEALYTAHCTLYTVQCTMYTVPSPSSGPSSSCKSWSCATLCSR